MTMGGGVGTSDVPLVSLYVDAAGDDGNDGLTEGAAFKTLPKAYESALAVSADRIVVLSDIDLGSNFVLTADGEPQSRAVTVVGKGEPKTLTRTAETEYSVVEVSGGAKVVFQNITIDGKAGDVTHRGLILKGLGTEVTLGSGTTVTGKRSKASPDAVDAAGGGGVRVVESAMLVMEKGARIVDCETFSSSSGVIVQKGENEEGDVPPPSFIMNGGEISRNIAGTSAGGLYINRSSFVMNGGTISDNTAVEENGYAGGVFLANAASFTMNGGTISGNRAKWGGGVSVQSGTFAVSRGSIYGTDSGQLANTATEEGGGAVLYYNTGTIQSVITIAPATVLRSPQGDSGSFSVRDETISLP
jgi:hypothetical protein